MVDKLVEGKPLPNQNKAHRLAGGMAPFWEYHIESDWLLIGDEDENEVLSRAHRYPFRSVRLNYLKSTNSPSAG
ncbi:MAG: type II toxin-antitoxin system YafQ family toxin [Magnetococcus sp. THC-1_WYH]